MSDQPKKEKGEKMKTEKTKNEDCGVRWTEWNRQDRIVEKEKIFKTGKARTKFVAKIEKKDNFNAIESWWR